MTLPSTAYRGHAAPTWDTKTIQQMIDYLQTTTLPVLDNRYARSPLSYFCDVANGDGISTITSVSNATWTKINAAGTVNVNNGGGWDSTTDVYTAPASGTYYCQAPSARLSPMPIARLKFCAIPSASRTSAWQ